MRVRLYSGFSLALVSWFLAVVSLAGEVVAEYSVDPAQAIDPETGIRVPPGFSATVFADVEGYGRHYATGIRNAMAMAWNPAHQRLYFLSHGRDALYTLYPESFSAEDSAELPSEEMHILVDGGDYGWPFTYFDHLRGARILAQEYGGDGQQNMVFVPFLNDMPGADWEVFADGFEGRDVLEDPSDAVHRPTGIEQGQDGEIYVSSTVSGSVWRIDYLGE